MNTEIMDKNVMKLALNKIMVKINVSIQIEIHPNCPNTESLTHRNLQP